MSDRRLLVTRPTSTPHVDVDTPCATREFIVDHVSTAFTDVEGTDDIHGTIIGYVRTPYGLHFDVHGLTLVNHNAVPITFNVVWTFPHAYTGEPLKPPQVDFFSSGLSGYLDQIDVGPHSTLVLHEDDVPLYTLGYTADLTNYEAFVNSVAKRRLDFIVFVDSSRAGVPHQNDVGRYFSCTIRGIQWGTPRPDPRTLIGGG